VPRWAGAGGQEGQAYGVVGGVGAGQCRRVCVVWRGGVVAQGRLSDPGWNGRVVRGAAGLERGEAAAVQGEATRPWPTPALPAMRGSAAARR